MRAPLRHFSYQKVDVPETFLQNSGRELNRTYWDKLVNKVVLRMGSKMFLPYPIRAGITMVRSVKYLWAGVSALAKGRIEVPVLDGTAIGVSLLRNDINTAGSIMFLLGIGEILEEWTHKKSVDDLARSMSLNVSKVWLCQDGQEILVSASEIKEGDEVITCAYTYTASASVVCHVGAKLILIDTQRDSLEMDYEQLENAITEKTKVIIPVDLGGVPCDYDRIFSIVERKKDLFHPANKIQESIGRVIVMADAAHAFGATWKEKPVGSIADFSNFSFHAVKNFTTAEGGAAVWKDIEGIDNEEIYHQYQLLSLHGQSKDALAKTQLGAWEYDIIGPWFKCNMTDVVAGIGLAQMKRYKGLSACSMWLHRPYEQRKEEYINLRYCNHSPQNNVFR